MSAVEWTDAEREALARALWPTNNRAFTRVVDVAFDALAPFVAAREAQAAAKALREAADEMERIWVYEKRTLGMATDNWLRARADRIERGAVTTTQPGRVPGVRRTTTRPVQFTIRTRYGLEHHHPHHEHHAGPACPCAPRIEWGQP